MKKNIIVKTLSILAIGYGMTSCLDGNLMNTPPGGSPNLLEMAYVAPGGTLINSGLVYFPAQALLLDPGVDHDTVTFQVAVQGGSIDRDVTVTLVVDESKKLDNFAKDAIPYGLMPTSDYQFLSTTETIPQGKGFAEFKVVFNNATIDFSKSVMLPITATNDAGYITSSNFGVLYLHLIGNPIAGLYDWDFTRTAGTAPGSPVDSGSFTGHTGVLSPQDPTTILTPTGYYSQPNYIITFEGDTRGSLTKFKVILDPVALAADWDTNGISVTVAPSITVNADQTEFEINYVTATRRITDKYVLQ